MTSNDRHASHNSPYRTGQHMPLNQSRHAPLTSVATSAVDSRVDLSSPQVEDTSGQFTPGIPNGNIPRPSTPGGGKFGTPSSPYSPGMRSNLAAQRTLSNEVNPYDKIAPGEIQMQSFQEGLPPPPPVQHSWKKIDRWAEENYQELYDQLAEGATGNDVNELEHDLDISLPVEVRESLQVHDGQERGGRPTGIIFGCMLLDCEEIMQEWRNWKVVNEEYLTPANKNMLAFAANQGLNGGPSSSSMNSPQQSTNPLWRQQLLQRQESQPPRAIQQAYAHPGWIPLVRDWGGNNLAVDLAPGPTGRWGQVIIFGRDYDCKYVVARSWSAFLAMVSDDLNSGKWFVEEESGELKLREFKTKTVEPGYLDILRWRMDQKYGRRGPRRRPTAGSSSPGHSSQGSPYGSPTEERGRSPQRFPQRRSTDRPSVTGSVIGKPSPLGLLSEENQLPKLDTSGDGQKEAFSRVKTASSRDDDLVALSTPSSAVEPSKQNAFGKSALSNTTNAEKTPTAKVAGLGVDGIDEMKNIEI